MLGPGFYNMDCMEGMKQFPDKFFDLAIVDPPYGDGGQKIGGGYDSEADSTATKKVSRTGGTWATKYGKKSLRGTLPRETIISRNCFASHAIKSSGAAITSHFHQHGVLSFGAS